MFLLGLADYNSPQARSVLANMLRHGNFTNLYSYGAPTHQQQEQDDAQYETPQQLQQAQQQQEKQQQQEEKQQQAQAGVSYPADTHYVDITEAIRNPSVGELELQHQDFLFTHKPLSTTLQINMPKKLIWNMQMGLTNAVAAAAGAGAGAASAAPQQEAAAATAAAGSEASAAAATAGAGSAPPSAPAPAAAGAETVSSQLTGLKEVTVQNAQGQQERYLVIEETKTIQRPSSTQQ